MMKSSVSTGDQLKALSSEILERFNKLDSMQSEDEDSRQNSPRERDDDDDETNEKRSDDVQRARKKSSGSRISNPSSEDPKFVVVPEDADVACGDAASFKCVVEASTPLDVFWFTADGGEAGNELEESVKYSLREKSTPIDVDEAVEAADAAAKIRSTHELRVFDVGDADVGRYYCVCVNTKGRNATIFSIACHVNENKSKFQSPKFLQVKLMNWGVFFQE